eukprot:m.187786 g.187786  ORF g.187786 m.187786 type:complete len:637 (-) comp21630_c0_seq6:79-1989(-)
MTSRRASAAAAAAGPRGRCQASAQCSCRRFEEPLLYGTSCAVCGHDRVNHAPMKPGAADPSVPMKTATAVATTTLRRVSTPLVCKNKGCEREALTATGYCSVDCMPRGRRHQGVDSVREIRQQREQQQQQLAVTQPHSRHHHQAHTAHHHSHAHQRGPTGGRTTGLRSVVVAEPSYDAGVLDSARSVASTVTVYEEDDGQQLTRCVAADCDRLVPLDLNGLQVPYCSEECYLTARHPQYLQPRPRDTRLDHLSRGSVGHGTTIRLQRGDQQQPLTVTLHTGGGLRDGRRGSAEGRREEAGLLAQAADAARARGDPYRAEQLYVRAAQTVHDGRGRGRGYDRTSSQAYSAHLHTAPVTSYSTVPAHRQLAGLPARQGYTMPHTDPRRRLYPRAQDGAYSTRAAPVDAFGWSTHNFPQYEQPYALDQTSFKASAALHLTKEEKERVQDEMLLQQAGWTEAQRRVVLNLFRQYAEDRPELQLPAFSDCFSSLGLRGDLQKYFAAFDRHGNGTWLSSADFLVGVVALDPNTPHHGDWREVRAGCLFRFYAEYVGGLMLLPHEKLTHVLADIDMATAGTYGRSAEARYASRKLQPRQEADKLNPQRKPLTERQFASLVVSDSLPGTAHIYRWCLLHKLGYA